MDVTAQTKYGRVGGEELDGFAQFLGIPYAKAPVGQLRFRRPQPVDPWEGIRPAKSFGAFCPQPGRPSTLAKDAEASEDCLSLNIFTPACDGKLRPVVVWIHGGAYMTGCASGATRTGGHMCRDADIVVVTIQYRLGAFGQVDFGSLAGAKGRFDANCGTWDQVAAVNWVIENIAAFGGDPECLTLMGESAGASSVLTLITTPCLKGKIKRAILESPAPFLIHTKENGCKAAREVLKQLNIPEEEAWRVADLPAETLVQAVKRAEDDYVNIQPYLIPTGPVVDGDLIPESPYDAVMHGAADGMEVLIGTTRDEGTLFAAGKPGDIFPSTEKQLELFFANHPHIDPQRIQALYKDYPSRHAFQEIGKEIVFHLPTVAMAKRLTQTGKVYLFCFEYAFPLLKLLKLGAVHCATTVLISGGEPAGLRKLYCMFTGSFGNQLSEMIHSSWCGFIASGNPNTGGKLIWPEFGEREETLVIDRKCKVVHAPSRREQDAYGILRPFGN